MAKIIQLPVFWDLIPQALHIWIWGYYNILHKITVMHWLHAYSYCCAGSLGS